MTTPAPTPAKTLTKSQMKRAVRENKPRTRNVLFNPFQISWPAISREAAAAVITSINSCVQQFHIVTGVPQEEYVRLLAAGDRKGITAARRDARERAAPLLAARRAHLQHCVVGFNAASRALEAGRLAALLVEAETPALETKMLSPLARGRGCPAVCVRQLRATLQARLGIETAVFGLGVAAAEEGNPLYPLYRAVRRAADPGNAAEEGEAAVRACEKAKENDNLAGNRDDQGDIEAKPTAETEQSSTETTESKPQLHQPHAPIPPTSATEPASSAVSQAPLHQADFISFAGPAVKPAVQNSTKRSAAAAQLDNLMCIDTRGTPHRQRLQLKRAQVMQVTLGNKKEKKKMKRGEKAARKPMGAK